MVRWRAVSLSAAVFAAAAAVAITAAAAPKADSHYSKTYNDCMDTAGGSTMPMKDCIGAEFATWDKQLNQTYQALMARRTAPEKITLRNQERAWLSRTQFKCAHAGDDDAGGSLQTIEIDQCKLDETILRTVYLQGLR